MKPMLDKEEVEQLNEQQLEAYANSVLSTERERRALLKSATGYRGRWLTGLVFLAVFVALSFLDLTSSTLANTILCFTVFVVVQWHATGINRRIDSAIRLMREEGIRVED